MAHTSEGVMIYRAPQVRDPSDPLLIDPKDASAKQLMLAVYESQLRMELMMSELSTAVTDLQNAVDGVAQRLLPKIEELEAANGTLEEALSAALADDAEAAAALEDAKAATAAIRAQVDELNGLGADPSTPVDSGAHPDNTLPNEIPVEGEPPVVNPL